MILASVGLGSLMLEAHLSPKLIWGFPKMGMPPNHPELDQGLKPMTWGSATEKTATIRASALGRSQRGPGQCQVALGADFGLGRSTLSWQAKSFALTLMDFLILVLVLDKITVFQLTSHCDRYYCLEMLGDYISMNPFRFCNLYLFHFCAKDDISK